MSLYIGNNGSEKILHIYDSSSNVEKTPFSGTSFHSSLPYITVRNRYTFYPNGTIPYSGNEGVARTWTSRGYTSAAPLPSDFGTSPFSVCIGHVGSERYFMPATKGLSLPDGGDGYGNAWGGNQSFMINSSTTGYIFYNEWTQNYGAQHIYYGPASQPLVVFDRVEVIIFNAYGDTPIANDISITNNDIIINGSSIFSRTYVHFMTTIDDRLNDFDDIIAIPYGSAYSEYNGSSFVTPNWVSSSSNLSFANKGSGGYFLMQLINSYPYPKSNMQLDGVDGTISVVKNNIPIVQFKYDTVFMTKINTIIPKTQIVAAGVHYSFWDTGRINVLVKTINISATASDIIYLSIETSNVTYPIPVACVTKAGNTVYLASSDKYMYVYCTVSTTSINVYVAGYDSIFKYVQGGHYWTINMYLSVTLINSE